MSEQKDDHRVNPHLASQVRFETWGNIPVPVRIRNMAPTLETLKHPLLLSWYQTLGRFSLSELGVPKQKDLTDFLPDITGINYFGKKWLGLDEDVILPSNAYGDLQIQGYNPADFTYLEPARALKPFQPDIALFRDPENPILGIPLLKYHPIATVLPVIKGEMKFPSIFKPADRRRGVPIAKVSQTSAELSLMNGFEDLSFLGNTVAIFTLNQFIREGEGKNLWDYQNVTEDHAFAGLFGKYYSKIANLALMCNIVAQFDGNTIPWNKALAAKRIPSISDDNWIAAMQSEILEKNIISFKQLLTGLLAGDRSEGLYATEYQPDQINFVMYYLFALVKSGEYKHYFSDDQMRGLVGLLVKSETKAHEYTSKTATQQAIFSSTLSRLRDAFFAVEAPRAFGLTEYALSHGRHEDYAHRVSSSSRFRAEHFGLKSLSRENAVIAERSAPKSNASAFINGVAKDPMELYLAAAEIAKLEGKDKPELNGTYRSIDSLIAKYQDAAWRKRNPNLAETLEYVFMDLQEAIEIMDDTVRTTVVVDAHTIRAVVLETLRRKDLNTILFLDYHNVTSTGPKRDTRAIDLKDKKRVQKLRTELKLSKDASIDQIIVAWVKKHAATGSGYAAIHLKGTAEIPKDIYGRDHDTIHKYAEVRVFLDDVKDELDRGREFYKIHLHNDSNVKQKVSI